MADRNLVLGRIAIVVAAGSASIHVALALETADRSRPTAVLLVVMAVACLSCTPMLLRGADVRTWLTMLGLTGALLYTHVQLCFDCGPALHEQTAGFLEHLVGAGAASTAGSLALWLMLAELVVASVGAFATLTHPTLRAAVVGSAVNPNRR